VVALGLVLSAGVSSFFLLYKSFFLITQRNVRRTCSCAFRRNERLVGWVCPSKSQEAGERGKKRKEGKQLK